MHQLYYIEKDPVKAVDSIAVFNQIKAIPVYLQLLCNAHHLKDSYKEMPYKPKMTNGAYSKWIIEGELNYQYVLLSLLQLLNRYKEFSNVEHACRSRLNNVVHPPSGLDKIFTEPPTTFLPLNVRSAFKETHEDYSLQCHRQAYIQKLETYFNKDDRHVEFWDSIPEWMPFKKVKSREHDQAINGIHYKRHLSCINLVKAGSLINRKQFKEVDIRDVAEELEDTEVEDF